MLLLMNFHIKILERNIKSATNNVKGDVNELLFFKNTTKRF